MRKSGPDTTPEGVPVPAFTPYRPLRARANGWTGETQREFIRQLTRIGSVRAAAESVGRSVRSAYALRDKPGAESFAAAWEAAQQLGREAAGGVAIHRALHGDIVPRYSGGRITGFDVRYNNRLLIGVLAGRGTARDDDERRALDAMRYRLEQWEAALRRATPPGSDNFTDSMLSA